MTICTDRAKILKELDKYWSLYVRRRDNRCILCGKYENQPEKLQAHHWIISRGKSLKYRFDVRNGVSLCYGCHIHQVHTNPTVALIQHLRWVCESVGIATPEEVEQISEERNLINKIGIGELRDMLDKLKADYTSLPQGGLSRR